VSGTEAQARVTVDVTMPRLSDSMEEATVLQWLKQPGERVGKGEPLVEVETDKATIVYEAELDGVLAEIVVHEGETAALGAVIARVAREGAAVATSQGVPPAAVPEPAPPAAAPSPPAVVAAAATRADRRRATPVARRLAGELGVSLAAVAGTGPGGRIVRADVRRAAGASAPAV
jgi:pyruvate dehydrogenase E2 component (dihydrolipoamide acetyltransferase)